MTGPIRTHLRPTAESGWATLKRPSERAKQPGLAGKANTDKPPFGIEGPTNIVPVKSTRRQGRQTKPESLEERMTPKTRPEAGSCWNSANLTSASSRLLVTIVVIVERGASTEPNVQAIGRRWRETDSLTTPKKQESER